MYHWIGVPSGTTPSGEPLPQYRAPFTVRRSSGQLGLRLGLRLGLGVRLGLGLGLGLGLESDSTAKDVTEIGTAGGLVIVQASLLEYPVPPYPVLRTHHPADGFTVQPRPMTAIGAGGDEGDEVRRGRRGRRGGGGGECGEGGGGGDGGKGGEWNCTTKDLDPW